MLHKEAKVKLDEEIAKINELLDSKGLRHFKMAEALVLPSQFNVFVSCLDITGEICAEFREVTNNRHSDALRTRFVDMCDTMIDALQRAKTQVAFQTDEPTPKENTDG